MRRIYLDNSATTQICEASKQSMIKAMELYGNPSSVHSCGLEAALLLNNARNDIAVALGIRFPKQNEIIFTSSGTEASNLAIHGAFIAKERRDANRIITTDSEHPSVENVMREAEKSGFDVVRISTKNGILDFEQLKTALDKKVFMISTMLVNNETGALYDVKTAFSQVKKLYPDAITHCDAVQAFTKVFFTPSSIGADMVTISGHKIHGPKGIGALYVNPTIVKSKKIVPIVYGGGQESGYRSGTENLIGIAGFAAAAKEATIAMADNTVKITQLRNYTEQILSDIQGITMNIPHGERAPHILNITLPHIKSETMLHFLSSKNIYVSSGSACSSHSKNPSRSLISFGLSAEEADCSIRISFSEYNTTEDADELKNALSEGIKTLIKIRN